ncbi:hypothetical protein [Hydrogenispora ethanolica]|uniref:hypothetical protein n=1 Tax=Hydrogenispora ethanolica TaxID=1082276 RepID=UPI001404A411|nr:hypothetical protein [Hydrogenispora ethanolica]
MAGATLRIVEPEKKQQSPSWPKHIPMPSDEDLEFLSDMSKRETGSAFFDVKRRGDNND